MRGSEVGGRERVMGVSALSTKLMLAEQNEVRNYRRMKIIL